MNYKIITDSACDLPWDYYKENALPFQPFEITMDGQTLLDDGKMTGEEFFQKLATGSTSSTSMLNFGTIQNFFEPFLQDGLDIVYVGLSTGLSGTYDTALLVKAELEARYPERKIYVADTRMTSLGEGILVHLTRLKAAQGASFEELCAFVDATAPCVRSSVTVNDLMFLHKGGRVSKSSAIVGSVLGIKPLLNVNAEGKLVNHGKIRGRKQSLLALVNEAVEQVGGKNIPIVGISHGDCLDDAKFVIEEMHKHFEIGEVIYNHLGVAVGSHAGPGTVALFFIGKPRY